MTGLGFYWDGKRAADQFRLDLGFVLSGRRAQNGNKYIDRPGVVPGTSETVVVCSEKSSQFCTEPSWLACAGHSSYSLRHVVGVDACTETGEIRQG